MDGEPFAETRQMHEEAMNSFALTSGRGLADNAAHVLMPAPNGIATLSEAELVQRYRETGDERFFEALYRSTRRRVFGACWGIVRDPQSAEDLCHDAFVRAYQRFERFEGTTFASWVCRIGINLSLNEVRHRNVVARSAGRPTPPAAEPGAESRLISRDALDRAVKIIDELEPRQRRAFLLRHLDELSHAEIEERTGWKAGQIRSYLQNARRNFRIAWKRQAGQEDDGHG